MNNIRELNCRQLIPLLDLLSIIVLFIVALASFSSTLVNFARSHIGVYDILFLPTIFLYFYFLVKISSTKPWEKLSKKYITFFGLLLFVSMIPRAVDVLDYDLWFDEVDQIRTAISFSREVGAAEAAARIQMPPTEILLTQFNNLIFGNSVFGYRWYSFCLGAIAPALMFFVCLLLSQSVYWSLLAYLVACLSPELITMSNLVRPYSSGIFLSVLLMGHFVSHLSKKERNKYSFPAILLVLLQSITMQSQFLVSSILILRGFWLKWRPLGLRYWRSKEFFFVCVAIFCNLPILFKIVDLGTKVEIIKIAPEINQNIIETFNFALLENIYPFHWFYLVVALWGIWRIANLRRKKTFIFVAAPLVLPFLFLFFILVTFSFWGGFPVMPRFLTFVPVLFLVANSVTFRRLGGKVLNKKLLVLMGVTACMSIPQALVAIKTYDEKYIQWTDLYREINSLTGKVAVVGVDLTYYGKDSCELHGAPGTFPFNKKVKPFFFRSKKQYSHGKSQRGYDDFTKGAEFLKSKKFDYILFYFPRICLSWYKKNPKSLLLSYVPREGSLAFKRQTPSSIEVLALQATNFEDVLKVYEHVVTEARMIHGLSIREALIDYYLSQYRLKDAKRHVVALKNLYNKKWEVQPGMRDFTSSNARVLLQNQIKFWEDRLSQIKTH